MDAALTREHLLSLRPPAVELTLPGHEGVSFRTLAAGDLASLAARLDLPPVEFAVETLAGQAEDLPDAAAVLRQLPRQTLLRLVRSWAAHPNAFRTSPSQIISFSDFKLIAQSKVDEFLRPVRELSDRLSNQFSERLGQFSSLAAETQKILATISEFDRQLTVRLARSMKALAASFDSAASTLEDDARVLGKNGWTMPMWGPIEFVHDLAQLTAQELNTRLLREYSLRRNEREKQLLSGLIDKPALLHWRPLLSECIDVFRSRKYRVVVPSLLTVVEGAMVSVINLYSNDPKPKKVAAEAVRTCDPGVIRLAWVSVQAFLDVVFLHHPFSASKPPLINRHWICHGRDVPEWGKVDCLRLFQALDTIAAISGTKP